MMPNEDKKEGKKFNDANSSEKNIHAFLDGNSIVNEKKFSNPAISDRIVWNGGTPAAWSLGKTRLEIILKEETCYELISEHELFIEVLPTEAVYVDGAMARSVANDLETRTRKVAIVDAARDAGNLNLEEHRSAVMKIDLENADSVARTNGSLVTLQRDFRGAMKDYEFREDKYKRKVARAIRVFNTRLGESAKAVIKREIILQHVWEAWNVLNAYYSHGNVISSRSQMIDTLSGMKWDAQHVTLAQHFDQIETLVETMAASGIDLDEGSRISFLRNSIRRGSDIFQQTLELSDQLGQNYEETKRSLNKKLESLRVNTNVLDMKVVIPSNDNNKITNGNYNQQKKNNYCYICGSSYHLAYQCPNRKDYNDINNKRSSSESSHNTMTKNDNSDISFMFKMPCAYCNGPNHSYAKCWQRIQKEIEESGYQSNRGSNNKRSAPGKDGTGNFVNNNSSIENNSFSSSRNEGESSTELGNSFRNKIMKLSATDRTENNRMVRDLSDDTESHELSDLEILNDVGAIDSDCCYACTTDVPRSPAIEQGTEANLDGGDSNDDIICGPTMKGQPCCNSMKECGAKIARIMDEVEYSSYSCRCDYFIEAAKLKTADYDEDGKGNFYKKGIICRYVIDGGASKHMTPYINHIRDWNYKKARVQFGNGTLATCLGRGNLSLYFLHDVLFLPGTICGTISVSQLDLQGLSISYSFGRVKVMRDSDNILMTGTLAQDGLYYLDEEFLEKLHSDSVFKYYY